MTELDQIAWNDVLKGLREALSLSQLRLAIALHVEKGTVQGWESGAHVPTRALQSEIVDFYKGRGVLGPKLHKGLLDGNAISEGYLARLLENAQPVRHPPKHKNGWLANMRKRLDEIWNSKPRWVWALAIAIPVVAVPALGFGLCGWAGGAGGEPTPTPTPTATQTATATPSTTSTPSPSPMPTSTPPFPFFGSHPEPRRGFSIDLPAPYSTGLAPGQLFPASGAAGEVPAGQELRVVVLAPNFLWYPQGVTDVNCTPSFAKSSGGRWTSPVQLSEPGRGPEQFDLVLVLVGVGSQADDAFRQYLVNGCRTGGYSRGLPALPTGATEVAVITIKTGG